MTRQGENRLWCESSPKFRFFDFACPTTCSLTHSLHSTICISRITSRRFELAVRLYPSPHPFALALFQGRPMSSDSAGKMKYDGDRYR